MKKSIIVAAICLLAMALSPMARAVEPVDPHLMPEARRLLDYIVSVQGKGIITGMERTGGGQGPFPAVLHVSGREPAIYGTDIYGYHTKFNETYHGVVKAVVAKSLQWWQDKGGIVEIHYHWGKPTDPNGSAWKNKPKGAKLLDLAKTLTPGTDEYKAFHSDLSVTADYLKQLADAKVPVLWRPFHEIDGGWFWWTDPEKPENTAALYRQMFRYLVKERGLHNLIWVYNAAHVTRSSQKPKDAAFADEVAHRKRFYPGGEYVDIASIDAYPNPQLGWNAPWEDARQKAYELMQAIAPGKPLAISEDNGPLNPDSKQCPPWVFDMAWFSMLCPADWTRRAFNHDHMITLDELPLLADRNAAPNVRIERPTDSMAMATADIEVTGFASDRNGNLESVSVHGLSEPWLTCEERDDEAVQKAFAGGKALGEARLGADGRWTFTWNDAPAGYHNLVAIAKDKAGAVSSSNVARVTVRIENLARGKAATASSSGKGGRTPPEAAVDGDLWTSWRADKDAEGPQWLQVDLGAERRVGAVCVTWYKAYAKDYAVQVSADGRTWRDAGKIAGRNKYHGDSDFLRFEPVQARHLRLFCAKPAVTWATYGVWELAVYEGVPR